jgi:hypothetical protein
MNKLIIAVILFSLSATTFSYAQTKGSQKDIFQATYETSKVLIASKDYQFVAELVYNDVKREKLEPNSNVLRLNKTKVSGTLKAIGNANKSVEFAGTVKKYNAAYDDNNQSISVDFLVNGDKVHIEVMPNGKAMVTCNLKAASAITWLGKLIKL